MPLSRAKLLELRSALAAAARASEPWEESYKQDRPTFRRLVAQEQLLESGLYEHYWQLAQVRLSKFINWPEVFPKLSADTVVSKSDAAMDEEQQLLIQVILPHIEELMQIGADAAGARTGFPSDLPDLHTLILDNAHTNTAELVKDVSNTTRNLIKKSIQSSIDRGETLQQMTERLKETVANPVRSKMIAQTETVNAYQSGLYEFAQSSGAKEKEWEAKAGACQICQPLDGQVKPLDGVFETSIGPVQRPAVHPRCRCGLIYNY